jgi:hypothetical protein
MGLAATLQPARSLPISGTVNVKPFTVDPVNAAAVDPNIGRDFLVANQIWNQVGISFNNLGNTTLVAATPTGGWSRYDINLTLNTLARKPAGGFAYYIVPSFNPSTANGATPINPGVVGTTWSWEDVGTNFKDPNNAANNVNVTSPGMAVLSGNQRTLDTLAHEIGHELSNRYQWRPNEANGSFHSGSNLDLMFPTVPNGGQIRNNIGRVNNTATRIPFITASYLDSGFDSGGTDQGNMVAITRTQTAAGVGATAGTRTDVNNINWGNATTINNGGNIWTVHEMARKMPNQINQEQISFFFTSNNALGAADTLNLMLGQVIPVLGDGYLGVINTLTVTVWQDILAAGAAGNGTVLTNGVDYTTNGFIIANGIIGSGTVNINNPGNLANIRDIMVTFQATTTPEPGSFALLGAGLLSATGVVWRMRRKRQA